MKVLPFTYRNFPSRLRRPAALIFLFVLLTVSGCMSVGPDYAPPETRVPERWNTELKDGLNAGAMDSKTMVQWWKTLNDPLLTGLIEQTVAGNLDLKKAMARVREARARRGISKAGWFPTLDVSGSATRSSGSENTGSSDIRELYTTGFDSGWEIDIFGGVRRAVEAADADIEAGYADMHDVRVSLTAETTLNYIEARTYQARLSVAEANLNAQQETFDLIQSRYDAGLSDELALQQARFNLESTRSQIPTLRSGLEGAKNRLAVLTGQPPGSVHVLLAERKPIPVAPAEVTVGIPAETLRRRPDIRKAERELAAQTARIGISTAELYPKLRMAGSIGLESIDSALLFKSTSKFWKMGPSISWNIFDAGAIRSNIKVQSAIQEQYVIAYESAILNALEEVENDLTAYAEEQVRRERLVAAVDAAQQAEQLSWDQYRAGLVDFSTVLDAQRSLLSFQDQLAQSEGAVTSNLVRLYKALGGGWISLASTMIKTDEKNQELIK